MKKGRFYLMSVIEIENDELIEELNATKSENLLTNELTLHEAEDFSECSDSAMSSINLNDACFALEEMLIETKSSPTLANSDSDLSSSSVEDTASGSTSSDPSGGNVFFYAFLACIVLNAVDKHLSRGRRRLNPLA